MGQASLVLPVQAARNEAGIEESFGASAVCGRHGFNTEPKPTTKRLMGLPNPFSVPASRTFDRAIRVP
ncbi:hypothetical protein RE6C_02920 [Rhodopirellula europaea 6C]|uniref:Uncharacterized protein n=1 Tax=Rhodopirellula europaea 6C TaxID=1263867 RepID=M2AHG3_9BACT|nr:hypothetical protein RE6C_02920 [Rhodopirellula europaea 6C]